VISGIATPDTAIAGEIQVFPAGKHPEPVRSSPEEVVNFNGKLLGLLKVLP
jgi:hypothetical protein